MQRELTINELKEAGIPYQQIRKFQSSENWIFAVEDADGTVHIKNADPFDYMDACDRVLYDRMPDVRVFKSVDRLAGYMEGFENEIDRENRSRLVYQSAKDLEEEIKNDTLKGDRKIDVQPISVPHAKLIDDGVDLYVLAEAVHNGISYDVRMDIEKLEYGNLPIYGLNHPNLVFVNATNDTWRSIVNCVRMGIDRIRVGSYIVDNYEVAEDGRIGVRKPNVNVFGLDEVASDATPNEIEDINTYIEELQQKAYDEGMTYAQYREDLLRKLSSISLPSIHDRKDELEQQIKKLSNLTDEEFQHEDNLFELGREVYKQIKIKEQQEAAQTNQDLAKALVATVAAGPNASAQDVQDIMDKLKNTQVHGVAPGQGMVIGL